MTGPEITRLLLVINSFFLVFLIWLDVFHVLGGDQPAEAQSERGLVGQLEGSRFGASLALVVPFTVYDFGRLSENVQKWKRFVPCDRSRDYAQHIDVVFYFHKDLWKTEGMVRKIKEEIDHVGHCFRKVKFLSASLSEKEDKYPKGPTNMFFKLLALQSFSSAYGYMYYMEPDNFPCRSNWLDKIYEEATIPGHLWMKGSIIRDGLPLIGTYTFADHINGNAIYRLDDPGFFHFLDRVQKDLTKNPGTYVDSFDIAIYLFRRNRDLMSFEEYTSTQHLFLYTDFVQNMYRREGNLTEICSASPHTYLVHGRNIFE